MTTLGPKQSGRLGIESVTVGLSENVACGAAAEKEACAGILLGESWKAFTSRVEITSAFNSQVSTVGVFDHNVVTKFAGGRICGQHRHYSPGR